MCSSHSTNPASTATPRNAVSSTRPEPHPCSGPEMIAKTAAVMPIVESSAPSGSGRVPWPVFDSGTSRTTAARATQDDRDVDEEDRAPPEVVEDESAEQRARRETEGGDGRPDADRLDAFGVVEDLTTTASVVVSSSALADAHPGTGRDELAGGLGETGHERADAEQGEAHHQHLLPPVAVRRAARGEQQTRLDERVGVDHPLHVGGGCVQLRGEGGDRDVEDGVVEQHHELGQADDAEDQPALRMPLVGGVGSLCGGRRHAGSSVVVVRRTAYGVRDSFLYTVRRSCTAYKSISSSRDPSRRRDPTADPAVRFSTLT